KLTGYKVDIKSESDMEDTQAVDSELETLAAQHTEDYVADVEEIRDMENTIDIEQIPQELEDQMRQPGDPVMDADYEEGELSSEDVEEEIESAEERDAKNE